MVNEVFDVNKVKVEFLQGIAEEYSNIFTERQLEMSIYMLDEFCNACTSNNLVLIRIPEEQIYQPQQQQPYQQQYQQPPAYNGPNPFDDVPELPPIPPIPDRQQVQRNVAQMNAELQRAQTEVDLSTSDKPKTFAERIRDMRNAPKKQPGNKVNPGDD